MFKIETFIIVLALSGCAAGPEYQRPEINTPASFKENQGWVQVTEKAAINGAWWTVFNDAMLNQLEERVAQSNQSLQAAFYTYQQTQAITEAARASQYPTLGATVSSSNANTQATAQKSASLTVSWIPDIWGKVRRQVEADKASSEAALDTLRYAQLSLQGTLAQDYFLIRQLDSQTQLAQSTVKAYEKSLQITQNRYKAGVATAADVASAQSQLANAQVQQVTFGIQRAQTEHAIAVLTGEAPSRFSLAFMPGLQTPPVIPAGIPSQLLLRRPDLQAAERQMAAANAQIGVASSAYFPALTLSGQHGWRGSNFVDLFSAPNLFWSVGPSLALTLFDGEARRAAIAQNTASYQGAVAQYRQLGLVVLQQVEDQLSTGRILSDEYELQNKAMLAADKSLKLATDQYKAGIVSYLNVITAQAAAYGAHNAMLSISGQRYIASVALIQALGGGWGDDAKP
jgi:NodT family efflux transporter outer membrane factor (OMF) lipoprotein